MPRIAKHDVNAALDSVLKTIKDAAGKDGITSRADVKAVVQKLESPVERALTDRFFRFVDHRDAAPGARVTSPDVDRAGDYAKEHLLAKYDVNHNGFSKAEIAKMSRIGQLSVQLAAERKGIALPPEPPSTQLGRVITAAAKDCDYMSESDSTPAYVEVPGATTDLIAGFAELLHKALDDGTGSLDLSTLAVEERGDAAGFLRDQATPYDPSDDFIVKNAAAWQGLADALNANLSDMKLYKIGPKAADGSLAVDQGAYELLLLGKTADGKLAGVAFESVET